MRSKSAASMKAQADGRLLGSQSFLFFPHASFIVARFPVLEWQALGLQETSPPDTCIILRWKPGLRGQMIRGRTGNSQNSYHPTLIEDGDGAGRPDLGQRNGSTLVPSQVPPGSPEPLKFVLFSLTVHGQPG